MNEELYEQREAVIREIGSLRSRLSSEVSDIGDWKVVKCYEAKLQDKPLPYDLESLMADRQAARDRINELESQLEELEK